jgi:hypothetical protein
MLMVRPVFAVVHWAANGQPAQAVPRPRYHRRRRRHFEVHARLREPLVEWYQAVEDLDPGRVVWELPDQGIPDPLPPPRSTRTSVEFLDALVASLPAR